MTSKKKGKAARAKAMDSDPREAVIAEDAKAIAIADKAAGVPTDVEAAARASVREPAPTGRDKARSPRWRAGRRCRG